MNVNQRKKIPKDELFNIFTQDTNSNLDEDELLLKQQILQSQSSLTRLKIYKLDIQNVFINLHKHYETFHIEKSIEVADITLENYKYKLKPFIDFMYTYSIQKPRNPKYILFNQDHINKYILHLRDIHNGKASTINSNLLCIKTFVTWICEYHGLPKIKISLRKNNPIPKQLYTDEELKLLIQPPQKLTYAKVRNWCIVLVFISTGIRCKSLINIKVSDVNIEDKIIYIRVAKGNKPYIVNIDSYTATALSKWITIAELSPDNYLFENIHGEKFGDRGITKVVAAYNKSKNITKTSPHLFRHTFCTMMLKNKVPIEQVKEMMNHSELQTTMNYIHMYNIDIKSTYEKCNIIDNLIR